MNFPSGWELVLVLVVILVLFGAKRLPDSARSLGRSMRIFKAETKGLRDDSDTEVGRRDTTVTAEPLPPVTPPAPPRTQAGTQAGTQDSTGSTPVGDQTQHPRP